MRKHLSEALRVLWLTAGMLVGSQSCGAELWDSIRINTGINYDLVGQQYRLSDQDTLDLFDEKSFSVAIGWGEVVVRGLWAENKVTISDRSLKNLLTAGLSSIISGNVQVKLENQLEFKDYRWQGEDLFGSGYVEDRFEIEWFWPVRPDLRLRAEQRLTYVDYEKSTTYFHDYWLGQIAAGMQLDLGLVCNLAVDYYLVKKEVPDSSGLDYLSHLLTSSLDGFVGWKFMFRLDGQMERRRAEQQENRQDYLDLTGDGELEYELSSNTSLVFKGDFEHMFYDHSDEIYYNFWTATGKLGLSRNIHPAFSASLLPMLRRSKAKDTSIGETYRELGVELDLDYSGIGRLWANLAIEFGARDYEETEEESFYSGYTYLHPTLLLNYRISDEVSIDLFADHEPEWHKQKEDDFTTSLLSCSLNYRFR